ncbi:MAG: arylesterase [Gammaproteobacteria bacterium]|nr:MAG: arylesterase [Gammaproteobacteria bacterium]
MTRGPAARDVTADAASDGYDVLVLGDSISAAYGMPLEEGWVALAEMALRAEGENVTFHNASISGDTTRGGRGRLARAIENFDPELLIIELGGNDGLRGYPPKKIVENLTAMAEMAREAGSEVLILGMMIPTNYGPAYGKLFADAFADAAGATDSEFIPFFLEPIALDRAHFQPDGIHPTSEAQPILLEHVLPTIRRIIEKGTAE